MTLFLHQKPEIDFSFKKCKRELWSKNRVKQMNIKKHEQPELIDLDAKSASGDCADGSTPAGDGNSNCNAGNNADTASCVATGNNAAGSWCQDGNIPHATLCSVGFVPM